jgi:hypothetical protein
MIVDHSDLLARCMIARPSTMTLENCDILASDLNYLEEMYTAKAIQLTQTQLDVLATVRGYLDLRYKALKVHKIEVIEIKEAWV